ncbi:MAG TPA: hypothetical protein VG347_12370 [Verrucomicrobiae bacterium]|nr:hypothetical protein [Verrucomicrobiae bacterium]
MKVSLSRQTNQALTRVEVLMICVSFIGIVLILGILPIRQHPKDYGRVYTDVERLHEFSSGIKIWAGDHNDKYPMQLSGVFGGTLELMNTPDAWKIFQVLSNEVSPYDLVCPKDASRPRCATNFTNDLKNKISYFIAADATDEDPQTLVAGDDNFLLNQSPVTSGHLVNVTSPTQLEWDGHRHGSFKKIWFTKPKKFGAGYVLLADGSVQEVTDTGLTNLLYNSHAGTNRLFIP